MPLDVALAGAKTIVDAVELPVSADLDDGYEDPAETVRRAMDEPRIIGLKDSSASMIYFHQLISLLPGRPDWSLLIGPEELLAESVLLGGDGGKRRRGCECKRAARCEIRRCSALAQRQRLTPMTCTEMPPFIFG